MRVLLLSEDERVRGILAEALGRRGGELIAVADAPEAKARLQSGAFDGVVWDPPVGSSAASSLAGLLRRVPHGTFNAAVLPQGDFSGAVEWVNQLAIDFILMHPADDVQLERMLARLELKRAGVAAHTEWTRCLESHISSHIGRADKAFEDLVSALVMALDIRENESAFHSRRVALYCLYFAIQCGVDPDQFESIYQGALLHDLGKIGIPDAILLKPAALTSEERQVMQAHVSIGVKLLTEIERLKTSLDIPRHHHERFDGKGYPRGLSGTSIPLAARLFSIVDVYDALRSERPYKAPKDHEASLAILKQGSGTQFDPSLVEIFSDISPLVLGRLARACSGVRTFVSGMLACRDGGDVESDSAGAPAGDWAIGPELIVV